MQDPGPQAEEWEDNDLFINLRNWQEVCRYKGRIRTTYAPPKTVGAAECYDKLPPSQQLVVQEATDTSVARQDRATGTNKPSNLAEHSIGEHTTFQC